MKKLLYCAAALAMAFFAGSCQQENLEPVQEKNTVTFTVEAPANVQTKAIADGLNVNQLVYEVWLTPEIGTLEGGQMLYHSTTGMKVENGENKATLTLELVNDQKFTVLFWAQNKDAAAYNTEKLTEVSYANTSYKANNESLAAFYGVAYVKDCKPVNAKEQAASSRIELRRPFAQLNIGTIIPATPYTIELKESAVKVTKANTTFNVATSVATNPQEMVFTQYAVPSGETLITNTAEYKYASMNYLFPNQYANATVEYDIWVSIKGSNDFSKVNNSVSQVPLKENFRTNIVGNLLTNNLDYEIVVDADFNVPDEYVGEGVVIVKNNDDFIKAINDPDAPEHLTIELLGTQTKAANPAVYSIEIGADESKYYFGTSNTKTITINANGNKIDFVHKNTDWNYIRMVNENAKWIINDAMLTNSGANDGPWNRHDIRFYNAVELNNVTSDKAIALLNDGKLNNVQISDVHPTNSEAYGLWISAAGQTVSLNYVTITPAEGKTTDRAIKIADQYVDSPAKVTLSVENSTFVSQKKAAILVTSTAGAVINLKNIDITKVAADSDCAVWVDEDRADYAHMVVVKGGLCKVEGTEVSVPTTSAELLDALKEKNATVYLYPTEDGEDLKLEGKISLAEGVSLIGLGEVPVPVFNDWGSDAFANQAHFTNTYVENINFTNNLIINAGIANGNVRFKDCVFGGDLAHQGVHFDSGNGIVVFDNCTFVGRNMLGASLEKVIFNNCTFLNKKSSLTGADKWTGVNMWGKYEFNNCVFDTEAHCNVKCDGVEAAFNGCSFVDDRDVASVINNKSGFSANITFDGKTYIAEGLFLQGATYTVLSGEGFKYAATNVLNDGTKDVTIELANDIDLTGITWPAVKTAAAFVLDGKGHSIKNLTTSAVEEHGFYSTAMFTSTRKATTIKNLVVENADVTGKGGDNSHGAVLVACNYAALNIEGVTIKNSTVSNCDRSSALITYLYFTTATVKDCVVEGCTVNSIGTAGALLGMNNSHNFVATGNTVKNTTISSSEGGNKAGILIGTWQKKGTLTLSGNVAENSKAINAGEETNKEIGREA